MYKSIKTLISAAGVGAMLLAPAMARTRVTHAVGQRPFGGAYSQAPPTNGYSTPRTGSKYFGPYDERWVVMPNGLVLGTDPDPFIRSQMRREAWAPQILTRCENAHSVPLKCCGQQ